MGKLWLLRLVPNVKLGRWWCAAALFAIFFSWLYGARFVSGAPNTLTWAIGIFFCVMVAYITAVFHFITARTEEAFDELAPHLDLEADVLAKLRAGISQKPAAWVLVNISAAVAMWLLQSWLLSGSGAAMVGTLTAGFAHFTSAAAPLLVWLTTTCAVHGLVDNARLFRRLTNSVSIDLLDTRALMPFGRMAVSSTLMVFGSMAAMGIMWVGPTTNPWTTIPGLVPLTGALIFLFLAPVWPLHQRLKSAKRQELARLQDKINAERTGGPASYETLAPLLSFRREILHTHEWPFDISIMTRFGLYVFIVPLTWIGAALIENVVDVFVA